MSHYVENTGTTPLRFLEMFKSDDCSADVSLTQWLALTPPALVKTHLNVGDAFILHLQETKPVVLKP
jgi:oxalate decarboxylase